MLPEAKVHPNTGSASTTPDISGEVPPKLPPNYVIQVPKDRIYRVPPPENEHKYKLYTKKAKRHRRSCCRCCLAWTFGVAFALGIILAVAIAVFYFVFDPKRPSYSVAGMDVKGFNFSDINDDTFSPEFDITIIVQNHNKKIVLEYLKPNTVELFYYDVSLGDGVWPTFTHKGPTPRWIWASIRTLGVRLSQESRAKLAGQLRSEAVPLTIEVRVPVRAKIGLVKTWTSTIKTRCKANVDKLKPNATILSSDCSVDINFF